MAAGFVQVQDVTFRYRSGFALGPLSFSAGRGITALMGPNGAGKTTLSRLVCGVSTPQTGGVTVDGLAVGPGRAGRPAKRLVGYVPQTLTFPPRAQVRDVLHHAAWLHQVPGPARAAAVADALEAVRLGERARSRCRTLSGGMTRRLAVAQALVHSPAMLFLDEPTTGLDPQQRLSMRAYLRDLGADRTIIVATHLAEDVQVLADRVLVLGRGHQVFDGSLDDLLALAPEPQRGMSRIDGALAAALGPAQDGDAW